MTFTPISERTLLNSIRKDVGIRLSRLAALCLAVGLTSGTGCSSDDAPTTEGAPHGGSDSGSPLDLGAYDPGPVDPFTGDCSTARWGHLKPACWNCFCNRCKPQLDVCGEDCLRLMKCGSEELTGDASELPCEGRGFAQKCLTSTAAAMGLTEILDFDLCSISHHDSSERLRSCEKECAMTYVDGLCERYPEPDAG